MTQGYELTADVEERCDVLVVGSGAGGAVLAYGLVQAGLDVVMVEAGGYYTRRDFDLSEQNAYAAFYQDRGGRATADRAINVLQGRTVGGSTTVNWTTCFRTPPRILDHWARVHGIEGLGVEELAPHFAAIEARLGISAWPEPMANANNRALLRGARALGWEASPLQRNVRGCANSGYCGLGCPVDAKQSMHVTYLPDAVQAGLRLYSDVELRTLEVHDDRVIEARGVVVERERTRDTSVRVTVRPKVVALCGGAINSPGVLLRSNLDDHGRVGRRTFLHPVSGMIGRYAHRVDPFYGAPQSVGSHQFADRGADQYGFFLEAAPLHPMIAAISSSQFGVDLEELLGELPHMSALIALHIDGLLPGDEGGTVKLRGDGRPLLDYPVSERLAAAMRESTQVLARVHLAAGAEETISLHHEPVRLTSVVDLPQLAAKPYGAHQHTIFSAHQMGGCAMGSDPRTSVVRSDHRHHRVPNLFVVDGSVLPTSLGVNPSQTIYALARRATPLVASAVSP